MKNQNILACLRSCLGVMVILMGSFLFESQSVWAIDNCIQDVWQAHGNKQGLNCTANDVSLSSVDNICVDDGMGGCLAENTCIGGSMVTFTADFTMPLTAQERFDLGLYLASDGGGSDGALTGQCIDNVVTAGNSSTFINNDPSPPDFCGDIDSGNNPQVITQTVTVMCSDPDGDGFLNMPWCTSWRQPGANEVCDSVIFTTPGAFDAYPGSPSKCNCGDLNIDIFLETATITVTKSVNPTTVPETGGSVQYSVSVFNNASVNTVNLDSMIDDIYGDITMVQGDITATTCSLAAANPLPAGGPAYMCTFDVSMPPANVGTMVTDTVTACGTDSQGNPNICDDDDATVTYTDTIVDPALEKTAHAIQALAVDITYNVAVMNPSTVDTLDLTSLTDSIFGDITTVQGNVISTTCSVPQTIATGGNYPCSFVGRHTTTGLHTNVLDGAATDSDGEVFGAPPLQDDAAVNIQVTFP